MNKKQLQDGLIESLARMGLVVQVISTRGEDEIVAKTEDGKNEFMIIIDQNIVDGNDIYQGGTLFE